MGIEVSGPQIGDKLIVLWLAGDSTKAIPVTLREDVTEHFVRPNAFDKTRRVFMADVARNFRRQHGRSVVVRFEVANNLWVARI